MYRRQRQNAIIVNVGETQYVTLQVINFLCVGDKLKMPLHRPRSDTADIYKTQVDDLPQRNVSAEMRTMICTLTRNKKLSCTVEANEEIKIGMYSRQSKNVWQRSPRI
jgi:hypothetical protein